MVKLYLVEVGNTLWSGHQKKSKKPKVWHSLLDLQKYLGKNGLEEAPGRIIECELHYKRECRLYEEPPLEHTVCVTELGDDGVYYAKQVPKVIDNSIKESII